jgi:hypothetical protein
MAKRKGFRSLLWEPAEQAKQGWKDSDKKKRRRKKRKSG